MIGSALVAALVTGGLVLTQTEASNGLTISVEISKFRNSKGVAQVTLYDLEDDFLKEDSETAQTIRVTIEGEKATCEFTGLKPGKYAIALMHDEDEDGKMKTNFIGIPKEGIGVSNNARPRFGPPKWKDAVFTVADKNVEIEIECFYL